MRSHVLEIDGMAHPIVTGLTRCGRIVLLIWRARCVPRSLFITTGTDMTGFRASPVCKKRRPQSSNNLKDQGGGGCLLSANQ
jgi:hypothetical protein